MNHSSSFGGSQCRGSSRDRETFAAFEMLSARVQRAKRAADESLKRVNATPEPHTQDNPAFAAVAETHMADREALFAAMRDLDDARRRLSPVNGSLAGAGISAMEHRRAG